MLSTMMPSSSLTMTSRLGETWGGVLSGEPGDPLPDPAAVMRLFLEQRALLLRGFPFTKESFTTFSDACCSRFSSYVGGGFRFRGLDRESKGASGTLLLTTGSTQAFGMPLHGEMHYQRDRPDMLWFYCERPPAQKGQTTVADGRAVFDRLSDGTKTLLRERQLLYVRELSASDWTTTFQTSDVEELRRICHENRMSLDIRDDGSIRTEYRAPAIEQTHDGSEAFVNNALLLWEFEASFRSGQSAAVLGGDLKNLPLVVRLDDGLPLPAPLMEEVAAACEACTVDITWQKGDVVMVDNHRILHGRRKATGDREILVRLGAIGDAPALATDAHAV